MTCQKCGNTKGWFFVDGQTWITIPETNWFWKFFSTDRLVLKFNRIVCENCVVDKVLI